MAGHFSLFKLSCTTYRRPITTADQMHVYLFAYSVSNLCIALSASASRIGCDHVTSSYRLRPRHFIVLAAGTSLHRIGCGHVTSSHRLRPRHFIVSAAGTSLHRIGCGHAITAPPASSSSSSSRHYTFHSCRVYVFHFNIASPASAISARHHNVRICHDFV